VERSTAGFGTAANAGLLVYSTRSLDKSGTLLTPQSAGQLTAALGQPRPQGTRASRAAHLSASGRRIGGMSSATFDRRDPDRRAVPIGDGRSPNK
jgi:hypothetical protein